MAKPKINWHIKPVTTHNKDIVLDRYKRYLSSLGLRDETIKLYVGRMNAFINYAQADLPDIKTAEEYRNQLIDRRLSRSYINNTCFAIKKFYQMNNIEWSFIKLKPDEGVPYYFDQDDVLRIFSACTNIKHLAMLQTAFYGCLRSSELCRLDDSDVDLDGKTIRLRETKNHSDAIVYINQECADTLRTYLKIRPQIKIGNRIPLFYTDNMNPWSKGDVNRMVHYYKEKAGIKKPGAAHVLFRHTSATLMIRNGADCRVVKEILRHKDINTTLRYAHVSDQTKREMYNKCLIL